MRFGGWDRVATFGCGMQLAMLPWAYEPPAPGMYVSLCTYAPALGTWSTCVDQVVRAHTTAETYERVFSDSVDFVNLVCMKAGAGLAQFTIEEYQAAVQNASAYLQEPTEGPLTSPIQLDPAARDRMLDGVRAEFLNLDNSNDSVWSIYYYFGALIIALQALQWPQIRSAVLKNRFLNILRARFELPTIWLSAKHAQPSAWGLGGLLPTSLEGMILLGLFVVHTYALASNYSIDRNEIMASVFMQWLQGLANRSGILAFGLLPIMIVFSTRSNLVMKLTALRYTTFLVLHRWVGRLIVIDSIIHSIAFYLLERLEGTLSHTMVQFWWLSGLVALIICCAILSLATGALRSRWYETFLYTHIALAVLFFYFCWTHVREFGWVSWIFWSCGLWIAERVYRVYLMACNGGIIMADLISVGDDLLVVSFKKPRFWKSHATQYAFVYFLLPTVFWQSHPFTVNDIDGQLEIVISVKGGVTQILKQATAKRMRIPLAIEGPYGHTQSLNGFDKILLIAGGSGIPGPLALAHEYPKSRLIVVTRTVDLLTAYHLENAPSLGINMEVFYTGQEELTMPLAVSRGRPNFNAIIASLSSASSAAVVCCGPPALNDMVRNMVAATLRKNPEISLEYLEEYQIW